MTIGVVHLSGSRSILFCLYLATCLTVFGCSNSATSGRPNVRNGEEKLREYFYESGDLKRQDFHDRHSDKLLRSVWFLPDGQVVASIEFTSGNGLEIYLDESGVIQDIVTIRDHLANGRSVSFERDGKPLRVIDFLNGVPTKEAEYFVAGEKK